MTIDPKAVGLITQAFSSPVIAITTREGGRDNGLIALSGGPGSLLPEAPRITIGISKPNLTHDMILASKIFAVHLLPAAPEDLLAQSLDIVKELGGHSGRTRDKLTRFGVKRGETGCPILTDALLYVECRLVKTLDCEESTLFLADVVAAERLRKGEALSAARLWAALPEEWRSEYERKHNDGLMAFARRVRGLARA